VCSNLILVAIASGIVMAIQIPIGSVRAQESKSVQSSSVTSENEGASLEGHHHYQSASDRANDALLITEVKSALAEDGVADGSPIVVDCDHGKIVLSGVMKSAEDAKRAGDVAAGAAGVVAVRNQLSWH
jgi:osmotically-inducible protein OsmY